MTNPPYGDAPGGQWPPPGPPAGGPTPWPVAAPKQSRTPIIISLVVAFVAVALAIGAWFRPAPDSPTPLDASPKYSEQQVSDARKNVCSAYNDVYKATSGAGGQRSDDPTLKFVISINARLASQFSSSYLSRTLDDNRAAPPSLIESVRNLVSAYDAIVVGQLAGSSDDEIQPAYDKLDSAGKDLAQACK
jgi:hypothetical protein